jgi:hypothetical protein
MTRFEAPAIDSKALEGTHLREYFWEFPVYWTGKAIERTGGGFKVLLVPLMSRPERAQYFKTTRKYPPLWWIEHLSVSYASAS